MSEEKLVQLLTHMKRYGTLNNEDIPQLIKVIEELQASAELAWLKLEQLEEKLEQESLTRMISNRFND